MDLLLKVGMIKLRNTTLKKEFTVHNQIASLNLYGEVQRKLALVLPHQKVEMITLSLFTVLKETSKANSPKMSRKSDT